jgi:hypothetical protein
LTPAIMILGQLSVLVTACASTATAAGVVPMSIQHTGRSKLPLHRRSDTYTETITNNISYGGYFASISVGTPSQIQDVLLDTGSSDTWLLNSDASLCSGSDSTSTSSGTSATTTSDSGPGSGGSGGGFSDKREWKRSSGECISTCKYDS